MFYHIKIKYDQLTESGKQVTKTEEYLVDNCELHAEAEDKGYRHIAHYKMENADITHIKRHSIKEVINSEPEGDYSFYDATVADIFLTDDGKEKLNKYHIGLFAKDINDANAIVNEHMQQGYDMRVIGIKETKILEIL